MCKIHIDEENWEIKFDYYHIKNDSLWDDKEMKILLKKCLKRNREEKLMMKWKYIKKLYN